MNNITKIQFATKNEKFIKELIDAPKTNRVNITYWCNPTNISLNGEVNSELIGAEIEITNIETRRVIACGKIEDIVIESVEDMYTNPKVGGNIKLGMPQTYVLKDWLWEINDTLGGKYSSSDLIAGVYIRLISLPIAKKQDLKGNQAGRKIR